MKDALIEMALNIANAYLVPALKEYAAGTPGLIDDMFVDALANVLKDPRLKAILTKKA